MLLLLGETFRLLAGNYRNGTDLTCLTCNFWRYVLVDFPRASFVYFLSFGVSANIWAFITAFWFFWLAGCNPPSWNPPNTCCTCYCEYLSFDFELTLWCFLPDFEKLSLFSRNRDSCDFDSFWGTLAGGEFTETLFTIGLLLAITPTFLLLLWSPCSPLPLLSR